MQNIENIMKFISECEKLKSTYRYWVTSSGRKESTADHSWRLALMVLLLWKEIWIDIDVFHAVKISLIHDLAESITWDIDAYETHKNSDLKLKKEQDEKKAMEYLKNVLWWDMWDEIYSYWEEYENWETKEAKFVKALDKIETNNQFCDAWINVFDVVDFIPVYADKHIAKVPELKKVLDITKRKLKESYKKWWFEWKKEYDN